MRIAFQLGTFPFNHDPKEIDPMRDVFDVLGGRITISKASFGADKYEYYSDDGLVIGQSLPTDGVGYSPTMTTIMKVPEISDSQAAARWTAVEAYNHLYHQKYETDSVFGSFIGMRQLRLIASDQRGFQVWNNPEHSDFKVVPVFDPRNTKDDTEFSMFSARGATLLTAAQTMVERYTEVMTTPDLDNSLTALDASLTIGQALGATSMEHFIDVWNDAIAKNDPKMAARHVYRNLNDHQ